MKKRISDIIGEAAGFDSLQDKAQILRMNDSKPLRDVLAAAFRPDVKFLLPSGPVPYNPLAGNEGQGLLYSHTRLLYLFIDGPMGHAVLQQQTKQNQVKREELFVNFLESIDPKDAEMMIAVKDKRLDQHIPGITKEVVEAAFPEIMPPKNVVDPNLEETTMEV